MDELFKEFSKTGYYLFLLFILAPLGLVILYSILADLAQLIKSKKTISAVSLLLANLIPLFGSLFLGWVVYDILVLYWLEIVVVGAFNLPKMMLCPHPRHKSPPRAGEIAAFIIGYICMVPVLMGLVGGLFVAYADKGEPLGFGMSFIMAIVAKLYGMDKSLDYGWGVFALAMLTLSHGISFYVNFLRGGEIRNADVESLQQHFYSRTAVLFFTVLAASFLAEFLSHRWMPLSAVPLLVLLKIWIDLEAHTAERKKFAGTAPTSHG